MNKEGKYNNLQTDNFYAKHIVADNLTIKSHVIKHDIMTPGHTIKEMYESQKNTNCFDDRTKEFTQGLQSHMSVNNSLFTHLPNLADVSNIPEHHAVMCIDNGNLIWACNISNTIKLYRAEEYNSSVKVEINVIENEVQTKLNIT